MSTIRKGDWIETYSGVKFYPLDPRPEDFLIKDIAHALSYMCRYAGHTNRFYSVAEHSLHLSRYVSEKNKLAALLHDATEAYMVDVPRPVKKMLPDYEHMENIVWECLATKFGIPVELPEEVKSADRRICLNEKEALFPNSPHQWQIEGGPLVFLDMNFYEKHFQSPDQIRYKFLREFQSLTGYPK